MRKAFLHIFFLGMLFNTCLSHAVVMPHDAMVAASVQKEGQDNRSVNTGSEGKSKFNKDFSIPDWEDYDEFDFDDLTSLNEKGFVTPFSSVKENHLAVGLIRHSYCGKVYTDLNFSRLPRYNYISLRVLRI